MSGFFSALARDGARLPVWRDELYLELHRGTYTTHAWLKRANRQAEASLYTTDLLCALAAAAGAANAWSDTAPILESLWKRLLVNQFHDIVPGTAVEEAYQDTRRDFSEIADGCEALQRTAVARVLPPAPGLAGRVYTVFNPLPWDRLEHVRLPVGGGSLVVTDGNGRRCPSQAVREARASSLLVQVRVPAMSCAPLVVRSGQVDDAVVGPARDLVLDAPLVQVRLDARGAITSLLDKQHARDIVVRDHRLNEFQAFRDEPAHWEAWDIDRDYASKPVALFREATVEILERGPVRWRARVVLRSGGRTRLEQDVVLHRDSPRIDFLTRVRWHEQRTLLKVAFPLAVAARRATYEIPFGAIARPTVARTPRERARWEVAGQQWADLSEREYGVSLLNDCKYGYDCAGTTLRLTLIRSPRYPHHAEPMAKTSRRATDQGEHRFAYALLPHAGTWREAETVRRAREFNVPVLRLEGHREMARPALLRLDAANVQVSAVALAERPGDLVLRLFESHGMGGRVTLQVGIDCDEVRELDLNERPGRRVALRDGTLALDFRPFEIRTLRLTPSRAAAGQRETSDVR